MTDEIEQTRKEFLAFRDDCIWLVTVFNNHQNLFDRGPETDELLVKVAGWFFMDFSIVSQEYFAVLVGRLTDPASKGKYANLSVDYVLAQLDSLDLSTEAIGQIADDINLYSKNTLEARNKLVAHRDRDTILNPRPPKEWPKIEATQFVRNINSFCNLVAVQLELEPLDFLATPAKGDAIDLIKFLKATGGNR